MRIRTSLLAGVAALAMVAGASQAKELTFAFQGDANSMDPYNLNETFTLGFVGNMYEGLISRGPNLEILPGLAESWEIVEPTRWRFHLRKGVKFHGGEPFTADDVVFSADRVRGEGSDLKTRLAGVKEVIKVDDHTVDFVTESANPILHVEWETWGIMSKAWAEKNGALTAQSATGTQENFATRNTNGTGPFRLVSREADVQTVAEANPDWWGNATKTHNLTKVTFKPIGTDATRVAALLSGQVDMAYPIPVQDMKRVEDAANINMLIGPELRTIFLGMDQYRDELLYSNVKGKNPFKDKRVREAAYRAIDIEAIKSKVMRGLSAPSALMVAPEIQGADPSFTRLGYDPEKAKALLVEAGYPDGFEVTMDCPNDRYVNDEAICQAVVSMLAKVGIKVNLLAQTKGLYFKKVLAPSLDTSFYLLGWTPGSFDSWNVLYNIIGCYDEAAGRGKFNLGRYCSKDLDALTDQILSETDNDKRNAMIKQAWKISLDDVAYIPLHQQALAWGARKGVNLAQRADNVFAWRFVTVD
ncbi:MAG: ABC transporter substrate-binding protein [Pseudomonadota bacterium]|nr:ABC transporter substrate-binding protein [Pseudomonadota bacterium]